jgi:hypothetical protein
MLARRAVMALVLLSAIVVPARASAALPPIKHVWVIQLENHSYDETFNNAAQPYLWTQLRTMGQVLTQFHATGHASLDNYITQISGQAPNVDTMADCQHYIDVTPGIMATDGQVLGQGCVYPAAAKTLVDQLEAKDLTWRGYMEDMGNDPAREPATCGAPQPNTDDKTQQAAPDDQYAARHNPFVYFHSILDVPGRCEAHVVPLTALQGDLAAISTTPNFNWITPNLCNDGHDATPCAGPNAKGTHEGDLIAADAFLGKWVPVITGSPAFQQDGLLLITLDESSIGDSSACCGEPAGLNTPMPGITGPGGGRIGTLAISPYVQPGSTNDKPYNHYSLLRSMEDLFGIPEHLGYAAKPDVPAFGDDVYNRPGGGPVPGAPPLSARDAGSTGKAQKLRVFLRSRAPRRLSRVRRGFSARIAITGSDRMTTAVQVRLRRGKRVVASSGRPGTVAHGHGRLRVRPRSAAPPGRYRLELRAFHEGKVVARDSKRVWIGR